MNCQIETERGTCCNEAYWECHDCLRCMCNCHAFPFKKTSLCAKCAARRDCVLPHFAVALHLPEAL